MITEQKVVADTIQATSTTTSTNIAVLIPAHNEEACIAKAVRSVMEQTVCTSPSVCMDVIVIADNCSDKTSEIVIALQREFPNLYLTSTVHNKDKKAGALNHGFHFLKNTGRRYTYTFTMDADSVLDPNIIENGMEVITEQYGGICCRVGLLAFEQEHFAVNPLTGEVATWVRMCWLLQLIASKLWWLCDQFRKRIWWAFQNIEYSIAQSETVERSGQANCLCGPGTLFRTDVLQELLEKNGEIWHGDALVEDYWLTKQIQNAGYRHGLDTICSPIRMFR